MARFIVDANELRRTRARHVPPIYAAASNTEQKQKPKGDEGDAEAQGGDGAKKLAKKGEELKEEMDSLLDEIDAVLEENAEEFVKNYVQRGGE